MPEAAVIHKMQLSLTFRNFCFKIGNDDDDRKQLLSTYHVLGNTLNFVYTLAPLVLTAMRVHVIIISTC